MTVFNSRDPWSTGGRPAYVPPPVARRVRPQSPSFDAGRLFRTVLVIIGLLWAFNYVWSNYYLPGPLAR